MLDEGGDRRAQAHNPSSCRIDLSRNLSQNGLSQNGLSQMYNQRSLSVLSYIMQLVELPKGFLQQERAIFHKTLHIANNAFSAAAAFSLGDVGGPIFCSAKAMALAALFRTATVTIPRWRSNFEWLLKAAFEFMPIAATVHRTYAVPFWDAPPMVLALHRVASLFPDLKGISRPLGTIALLERQWGLDGHVDKFKTQRTAYRIILPIIYPPSLLSLIRSRVCSVFQIGQVDEGAVSRILPTLTPHCIMCVVKTWLNAWTTSRRMHEPHIMCCIFGCRMSIDTVEHCLLSAALASGGTRDSHKAP